MELHRQDAPQRQRDIASDLRVLSVQVPHAPTVWNQHVEGISAAFKENHYDSLVWAVLRRDLRQSWTRMVSKHVLVGGSVLGRERKQLDQVREQICFGRDRLSRESRGVAASRSNTGGFVTQGRDGVAGVEED